jgi:hypothetical protein
LSTDTFKAFEPVSAILEQREEPSTEQFKETEIIELRDGRRISGFISSCTTRLAASVELRTEEMSFDLWWTVTTLFASDLANKLSKICDLISTVLFSRVARESVVVV